DFLVLLLLLRNPPSRPSTPTPTPPHLHQTPPPLRTRHHGPRAPPSANPASRPPKSPPSPPQLRLTSLARTRQPGRPRRVTRMPSRGRCRLWMGRGRITRRLRRRQGELAAGGGWMRRGGG
ncbi:hypothetical protein LTS18_001052, partial [Coniosporium uncinatum]